MLEDITDPIVLKSIEDSRLIDPSALKITDYNNKEKTYILSRFPAVQGREIIEKYPHIIPKFGDYSVSEEVMLKLMSYVAVVLDNGQLQKLINKELINNHITTWEILATIETKMMEKNCSFFQQGIISNFFNDLMLLPQALKTLMDSLGQLSQAVKPPSTN